VAKKPQQRDSDRTPKAGPRRKRLAQGDPRRTHDLPQSKTKKALKRRINNNLHEDQDPREWSQARIKQYEAHGGDWEKLCQRAAARDREENRVLRQAVELDEANKRERIGAYSESAQSRDQT
jgi:hypothetical protein